LYFPVTGSGKIDSATGPNPENRENASFSSLLGGRRSVSMRFSVLMAAMMSRALAFSPLATEVCDASGPGVNPLGSELPEAGVTGGGGSERLDSGGGLLGGASKSEGWFRDALSRAT
jgi:hypothetical protein